MKPLSFWRRVPAVLIAFRFAVGPFLLFDARDGKTGFGFALALVLALLSDIFDGIIARRANVATPRLREADSWTDGWLGVCVALCVWLVHRGFVRDFAPLLIVWFLSDMLALGFDWLKFRRFAAYHAYSAKLAGLLLMSALFWLFAFGRNDVLLTVALGAAIAAHCERIAITALMPVWTPDIAGVWGALRRRRSG